MCGRTGEVGGEGNMREVEEAATLSTTSTAEADPLTEEEGVVVEDTPSSTAMEADSDIFKGKREKEKGKEGRLARFCSSFFLPSLSQSRCGPFHCSSIMCVNSSVA